jgi:hypothetical protein
MGIIRMEWEGVEKGGDLRLIREIQGVGIRSGTAENQEKKKM